MGIFNYWPYTNIHELNLDWVVRAIKTLDVKVDNFSFEIQDFVNDWLEKHPEATTTVQDNSLTFKKFTEDLQNYIKNLGYNYNNSTLSRNDDNCTLKGYLDMSAERWGVEHTIQGTEFYNGYLYVAHHVSDTDMMYISKYEYNYLTPDSKLAPITTVELNPANYGGGIHGNGLCIAPNLTLLLSDTYSKRFYIFDIATLTLRKVIAYNGTPISSVAFNNYALNETTKLQGRMVYNPSGQIEYTILMYNPITDDGTYSQVASMNANAKGNGAVQDTTASDNFIYTLVTNTAGTLKYNGNFIRMTGWNGVMLKDLYLPDSIIEPEGLTRVNNEAIGKGFVIVGRHGDVYWYNTEDGIIASSFFGTTYGTVNLQWGVSYSGDGGKEVGTHTINSHTYKLDNKLLIPKYIDTSASSLLNRLQNISPIFSLGGNVSSGSAPTREGNLRTFPGLIHNVGMWITLEYNIVDDAYWSLNAYWIEYIENGEMKVKRRGNLLSNTASRNAELFATDMEAILNGRTLNSYNFVALQGIGEIQYPDYAIKDVNIAI